MRDLRRPLWVFGLLLCVPAALLAALGWRSLAREHDARRAEAVRGARAVVERTVLEQADSLERLRAKEDARPYFEYATEFQPAQVASANAVFVQSPLDAGSDDPRLLGWFQWTLLSSGNAQFDAFGPGAAAVGPGVRATYEAPLVRALRAQAAQGRLEGRIVPVPLPTVAANEEKGQLQEELGVAQRLGTPSTDRLDNYRSRAQSALALVRTIDVRATPMRYLARPAGGTGPPLVAYRVVWIPGDAERASRDAPSDRWLLQGYALDPGRRIPTTWTAAGDDLVLCRGDCAGPPAPLAASRSVAEVLGADVLREEPSPAPAAAAEATVATTAPAPAPVVASPAKASSAEEAKDEADATDAREKAEAPGDRSAAGADPSLAVVAAPAFADLEAAFRGARNRFLLLMLGLVCVVAVGFATLLRSVRREMAVARKKEDFVAAVTHELKTPLAGIRMYADMLQGGFAADPDAAGDYAGRIVDEAKRLDALVDRVLAMAAADRGAAAFRPALGDLAAVVRDAVAGHAARAEEAGVALRVEVEPGLSPVAFDAALVAPLVSNLVDNAVKYSVRAPTKEVVVRVRPDGADRTAVVVADRGVGIPAADQPRVFEPFYRAGGEETRSAPGVGLGLALVRRYAEAHGATVSLESREGRGTIVTVSFPRGPSARA